MSKENENEKKNEIVPPLPTIRRWKPNHRYENDKFVYVSLKGFKSSEKSLTDKEAFRVSLASLRGQLTSGSGSPTVGSYSLKAGESYNHQFDFSYLNRPDLSLVDLHEFIEETRNHLENYDMKLRKDIELQLEEAEAKVKSMEKQEVLKAEKKAD